MIKFASLQFRFQAYVALVVLAIVAVLFGVTGPHLVHLYNSTVAPCAASNGCQSAILAFTNTDSSLQTFGNALIIFAPALIGMFWGAPLIARELETGTFRLALAQGITRTRWLATKIAVVGSASIVVTGLLSFIVTWWSSPLDRVNSLVQPGNIAFAGRFSSLIFGARNVAPVGYAAFAFALAVAAGLILRRTLPAMATALGGFVATRLVVSSWLRPNLIAPLQRIVGLNDKAVSSLSFNQSNGHLTLTAVASIRNAWMYSTHVVDKSGSTPTSAFLAQACPARSGSDPLTSSCLFKVAAKFHEVVTYQPGSRYWTFQWYELAIFLGLAVLLSGFCLWWVRRRLA